MRNLILIFCCLTLSFKLLGQEVCKFSILFPSNSYTLNVDAKSKIDSIGKTLSNIHQAYYVEIFGHTDNTGNRILNERLSKQRTETAKRYLMQNNFLEKCITCYAFADTKPVSDNELETGRNKNRRVDIRISVAALNLNRIAGIKNTTASYTVDVSKENTYTYSSGSKLIIPEGSFETMDGKAVSGKVILKYTEYRDQTDFLFSGISMSFFDENSQFRQFNSAGMFKIEAFQNNVPLKIKENSAIKINFVKTQSLPELKFFSYDSLTKSWKETNQQLSGASKGSQVFFYSSGGHVFSGKDIKPCVTKIEKKDSCTLYPCTGTLFAIRKGLELTSSSAPVDLNRAQIYFKTIKDPRNVTEWYRFKIEKKSKKLVEFKIIPGLSPSVFEDFINYSWAYHVSKKNLFNKNWENIIWLKVSLNYLSGNDFIMTLHSNDEKIILSVTAKVKQNGISRPELASINARNQSSHLNLILDQVDRQTEFDRLFSNKVFYEDSIDMPVFKSASLDSMICFYQYSKQWMDKKNR